MPAGKLFQMRLYLFNVNIVLMIGYGVTLSVSRPYKQNPLLFYRHHFDFSILIKRQLFFLKKSAQKLTLEVINIRYINHNCSYSMRNIFFAERIINVWNCLPPYTVC